MSKRKQAAIEAAANQKATAASFKNRLLRLTKPSVLATIGVTVLLAVGVLGATISASSGRNIMGQSNPSWLDNLFSSAPAAAANPALVPASAPTPRLSKEFLYAGSRLLSTEDAGAPNIVNQPSDLVIWRLSTGIWYVKDSTTSAYSYNSFGSNTDKAAPADFDGDGMMDFSVYRPDAPSAGSATWYIQSNSQAGSGIYSGFQFGLSTDIPVPADYEGDGRADLAVYRGSNATFYFINSSTNSFQGISVGQSGDVPMPADYDGDGRTDAAVYRSSNSTWIINQSSNNQTTTQAFGQSGDEPVRGDYDGDGKFDLAVRRNSSNSWLYRAALGGATQTIAFTGNFAMQASDKEVSGDYDGDGRTDPAVWRPATGMWQIQQSASNTLRSDQWGMAGDTPIAAPMKR